MSKPLYTVERYSDELLQWVPILCAQDHASKMYCKGYMASMAQYYPCPRLRVIDRDGTIYATEDGHGMVEPQQGKEKP